MFEQMSRHDLKGPMYTQNSRLLHDARIKPISYKLKAIILNELQGQIVRQALPHLHFSCRSFLSDQIHVTKIAAMSATIVMRSSA